MTVLCPISYFNDRTSYFKSNKSNDRTVSLRCCAGHEIYVCLFVWYSSALVESDTVIMGLNVAQHLQLLLYVRTCVGLLRLKYD